MKIDEEQLFFRNSLWGALHAVACSYCVKTLPDSVSHTSSMGTARVLSAQSTLPDDVSLVAGFQAGLETYLIKYKVHFLKKKRKFSKPLSNIWKLVFF